MRRPKFTIPISIVLFLAATLVGTYLVRKRILEQHMVTAMEVNDEDMVMGLAKSWPSPVNVRDELGTTPLNWAVKFGSVELVAEMVARGADVNTSGRQPGQPFVGLPNPGPPAPSGIRGSDSRSRGRAGVAVVHRGAKRP